MENNLTEWFDGTIAPSRVGWYERKYGNAINRLYWDGEFWFIREGGGKMSDQLNRIDVKWRGLTNAPASQGYIGMSPRCINCKHHTYKQIPIAHNTTVTLTMCKIGEFFVSNGGCCNLYEKSD